MPGNSAPKLSRSKPCLSPVCPCAPDTETSDNPLLPTCIPDTRTWPITPFLHQDFISRPFCMASLCLPNRDMEE